MFSGTSSALRIVPAAKISGGFTQMNGTKIVFSGLCSLALTAALALVVPARANTTHSDIAAASEQQDATQAQSVSGTIASVSSNSFTLTVGSNTSAPKQQLQQSSPQSMTFQTDQNTTIDGKLKVGANADVTYRQSNGNNIAISVRVTNAQ
jgi:hypothetical protein